MAHGRVDCGTCIETSSLTPATRATQNNSGSCFRASSLRKLVACTEFAFVSSRARILKVEVSCQSNREDLHGPPARGGKRRSCLNHVLWHSCRWCFSACRPRRRCESPYCLWHLTPVDLLQGAAVRYDRNCSTAQVLTTPQVVQITTGCAVAMYMWQDRRQGICFHCVKKNADVWWPFAEQNTRALQYFVVHKCSTPQEWARCFSACARVLLAPA